MTNKTNLTKSNEVKKLYVEATVNFAVNHIPNVDQRTLEQFLELVNVTGNFGTVNRQQICEKMQLIAKHIPNACVQSLTTLGELLDVEFPKPVKIAQPIIEMNFPFSEPKYSPALWAH